MGILDTFDDKKIDDKLAKYLKDMKRRGKDEPDPEPENEEASNESNTENYDTSGDANTSKSSQDCSPQNLLIGLKAFNKKEVFIL